MKINSARHQHDTERTQNRAGFSLRASSPIWVSEVSLARTRERGRSRVLARLASRPNGRACSQAKRDCSHRQLFRPFWGSSVWRNNQRVHQALSANCSGHCLIDECERLVPFLCRYNTVKFQNESRGLYFSKALFEGLIFGGAYLRREICISKSIAPAGSLL